MRVRYRLTGLLMTVLVVMFTGYVARAQPPRENQATDKTVSTGQFEVGQRWVYSHKGPRPGAMEPNAIDGQRILQVVSRTERDGQALWVIEERFTRDSNVVGRSYVDDAGWVRSLDVANKKGEVARLIYESAMVYQVMAMAVGEQETLKTKLATEDGKLTIPTTVAVRRLENETVVTAAGRFEACRHFEFETTSVIDLKLAKIPIKETRHRWHSDQINGLVKEVYEKDAGEFLTWSWQGYTAVSTLKSFGLEDIDANVLAAAESAAAGSGQAQNRRADRPVMPLAWRVVSGILLAGICLVGGVLVVRRRR